MDITITQPAAASAPSLGMDDLVAPPGADAAASTRFSELMDVVQGPEATAPVGGVAQTDAASPAHPKSLGDHILGGLQNVSSGLQQSWSHIGAAINGTQELRPMELLKLQFELSSMTVQYELVGKAVSRSEQNIDQLVKLQ